MTRDEIETLEELKRHYALRMGSGTRYYDALRAALRDAAALASPALPDALALRHAWEAGFRLCRSYGDNHHHFDGEQKERKWRDYIEGLAAPAPVAAPAPERCALHGNAVPCQTCAHIFADMAPAPETPAPDAMPENRGHQIVARDRDGMPWCETCRKWGVREDGPCDKTYPGSTGQRQEAQP